MFYINKKLPFCILIFCIFLKTAAQISVTGFIKDSSKNPVSNANIILQKTASENIVAYTTSDKNGFFKLTNQSNFEKDSFTLIVTSINFKTRSIIIKNAISNLEIILEKRYDLLPNVTVKNTQPAIKFKEDTLTYNVDSFKQKQDRTIGDVLKKMPGINVDDNGRISYNGRPISNFYIDGDNLLDDRYNTATNTITADMVKDVQVLENHQPIRILKNVNRSNKTGININLKESAKAKLIGSAVVGLGIEKNLLYDNQATVMAFKKKYKAINSLKLNNAANNIKTDVIQHYITDMLKEAESNLPNNVLSIVASNNSLPFNRYAFNKSLLLNTNNYIKLKNKVDVKANVFYVGEKIDIANNFNEQFFLPNNVFSFNQNTVKASNTKNLFAQITAFKNTENTYFNNTLKLTVDNNLGNATVNFNGLLNKQTLGQSRLFINNEFKAIKPIKKVIAELYSYTYYLNKPENLVIEPDAILFNANSTSQRYNVPSIFTNNYLSFRKSTKSITQQLTTGLLYQQQQLTSNINLTNNQGAEQMLKDSFVNNMRYTFLKPYIKYNFDAQLNNFTVSLTLPLEHITIAYDDTLITRNKSDVFNNFIFNPLLFAKYTFNQQSNIFISANNVTGLANVQQVNRGYLVENTNLLTNNQIPLSKQNIQFLAAGFSYRKTIKMLFFNVQTSYNNAINNSIIQLQLFNNAQIKNLIELENSISNYSINTNFSKYMFALKTNINVKANYTSSAWQQLQNNILLTYQNNSVSGSISFNSKISNAFTMSGSYARNFNTTSAKNNEGSKQKLIITNSNFSLNYIPNDYIFFQTNAEYAAFKNTSTQSFLFADFNCRIKNKKTKNEFVILVNNIANTKAFTTINIDANSITTTSVPLRERMIVCKYVFNF